jgi:hypothetical protein
MQLTRALHGIGCVGLTLEAYLGSCPPWVVAEEACCTPPAST